MDDFDSKLESILGNPQIMDQVMKLADQLGQNNAQQNTQEKTTSGKDQSTVFDTSGIRNINNLLGEAGIDKNQRALLRALGPYIGSKKMDKLERAMQAARMAQMASNFFGKNNMSREGGG